LPWPALSLGSLLGCGITDFRDAHNKPLHGANRLYTILISESLYLIWKLRCEWRIDRDADPARAPAPAEAKQRWIHAINTRLRHDCLMTDRLRYGSKALRTHSVHGTWRGTLRDESHLPVNWHRLSEVLVGIG
jgi:hypothetical protein